MTTIKDRDDILVERKIGQIVKIAKTEAGAKELTREKKFLDLMAGPFVPVVLEYKHTEGLIWLLVTVDAGPSQKLYDTIMLIRSSIKFLHQMRELGVQHGDLTAPNIIAQYGGPVVLDWGEAVMVGEDWPSKRPEPDAHHMWEYLASLQDGSRIARRWDAIRKAIFRHREEGAFLFGPEDGPLTFLDIGCYRGDITAAAAVEGLDAHGVDRDPHAIQEAKALWSGVRDLTFQQGNATAISTRPWNVVVMLSTFPYILQDYGYHPAANLVNHLIQQSDIFFFESQLKGDGPGPDFFVSTEDVGNWFLNFGVREPEPIIEIELPDRNTTRTTWMVTS